MSNHSETSADLIVRCGALSGQTVSQAVNQLLALAPNIIWAEPVPARSRLKEFAGLWVGDLKPLARLLPDGVALSRRPRPAQPSWPTFPLTPPSWPTPTSGRSWTPSCGRD